jgi:transposase
MLRWIGLDCHLEFIEVAISDAAGKLLSAGRIETSEEAIRLFAESLGPGDEVALESSGNAAQIGALIGPHVGRVVIANSRRLAPISESRAKTDRLDARTLAKLLRAGALDEVWAPDDRTRARRRLCSRRAALVRARTRAKNEVHAVIARNLKGRPPVSDLFGRWGRHWLAELELPTDERLTVDACLRQIDFLAAEIAEVDCLVAADLAADEDARRLLTIPGVGAQATLALLAAIGNVSRFRSARQLVAYLGLDPRVRQSGSGEARHGRISKQGPAQARAALVEAAQQAMRQPGPLRAFGARVRARRGYQVAAVAVARKLACLAWCLLTRGEDYAFARPSLTRRKLHRLDLTAGRPARQSRPGAGLKNRAREAAERETAERAEAAYRRLVADWRASGGGRAGKGAGAPRGRASHGPSTGPAARQASAPEPAL